MLARYALRCRNPALMGFQVWAPDQHHDSTCIAFQGEVLVGFQHDAHPAGYFQAKATVIDERNSAVHSQKRTILRNRAPWQITARAQVQAAEMAFPRTLRKLHEARTVRFGFLQGVRCTFREVNDLHACTLPCSNSAISLPRRSGERQSVPKKPLRRLWPIHQPPGPLMTPDAWLPAPYSADLQLSHDR